MFNARLRDEVLDTELFSSLAAAELILAEWLEATTRDAAAGSLRGGLAAGGGSGRRREGATGAPPEPPFRSPYSSLRGAYRPPTLSEGALSNAAGHPIYAMKRADSGSRATTWIGGQAHCQTLMPGVRENRIRPRVPSTPTRGQASAIRARSAP